MNPSQQSSEGVLAPQARDCHDTSCDADGRVCIAHIALGEEAYRKSHACFPPPSERPVKPLPDCTPRDANAHPLPPPPFPRLPFPPLPALPNTPRFVTVSPARSRLVGVLPVSDMVPFAGTCAVYRSPPTLAYTRRGAQCMPMAATCRWDSGSSCAWRGPCSGARRCL